MDIRNSKSLAWSGMILISFLIILVICLGKITAVWEYIPLFLAFMTVFSHLMALLLYKMSASASKKLDMIAFLFGLLTIIAIIVVFILDYCEFY